LISRAVPRRLLWLACHKPTFSRKGDCIPRRSIPSTAERESLLALPDTKDELIRHYTLSETDLSIIRQRRGPANRLGFGTRAWFKKGLFWVTQTIATLPAFCGYR
jgi:hypothetical protein